MYWHVNAAFQKSRAKSQSAIVVLLFLAHSADGDGLCYPSLSVIRARTRLSERSVRYALRELERLGEIKTIGAVNASNRYQVLLGEKSAQNSTETAPEVIDRWGNYCRGVGQPLPQVGQLLPGGGAIVAPITEQSRVGKNIAEQREGAAENSSTGSAAAARGSDAEGRFLAALAAKASKRSATLRIPRADAPHEDAKTPASRSRRIPDAELSRSLAALQGVSGLSNQDALELSRSLACDDVTRAVALLRTKEKTPDNVGGWIRACVKHQWWVTDCHQAALRQRC